MSEESPIQVSKALDLAVFELLPGSTMIEASAGTGKTYTIQYIVLDLLLKGLDLKEILVVTFTEAATRELSERLQSFLDGVSRVLQGESEPDQALYEVLDRARQRVGEVTLQRIVRHALLHMDEAPIFTIHGFCQRALQENPFAADAAFASEICTDPTELIERLVRDFLRAVNLAATMPLPGAAGTAYLCARGRKLTGLLSVQHPFSGSLETLFEKVEARAADLQRYQHEIDVIEKELLSLEGKLNGKKYNEAFFVSLKPVLQRLLNNPIAVINGPDKGVVERFGSAKIETSFKKAWEGTVPKNPFFKACDALQEAHASVEKEFLRYFDTWFIQEFNELKSKQGQITYDDMILHLDRALQKPQRLKDQLRRRYRAALVDEFQDTDSRQYSIFKTLFASDGGNEAGPFFAMIGDPKQSIYSFRGADINAYLRARADAHRRFTLPINYRSERGMIEAVNAFFAGVNMGEPADSTLDTSIPFEPVEAADRVNKPRLLFAGDLQPSRLYKRCITLAADANHSEALDASIRQMAVDTAEFLKQSTEGRILIEETVEGVTKRRCVRPGDIAVLVNRHAEAELLQKLLGEVGLLAVRGKSGDIFGTEEASHFLQFLRTCLNPGERQLNVLLVSALFGKTDAGMKNVPDSERQKIYELLHLLGRSWKEGKSVSSIWFKFLNEIGARARLLKRHDGERRMTNYLHLCELAQELERSASLSPERLTDRILEKVRNRGSGMDQETDANLIRLESDEQAIKLLTMHSAKGLEFPVVFLPSLWQKHVVQKDAERVTVCPCDPDCLESIGKDAKLSVQRQKSEALRIGYVAMTRAVHLCVYYNVPDIGIPAGNSNHASGWFDKWLCEERGRNPQERHGDDSFLPGLSQATPIDLPAPESLPSWQDRRLGRDIPDRYQITSYSALSRGLTSRQGPGTDPSIQAGEEELHASPGKEAPEATEVERDSTLLLECFPGGLRTGTCIHEVIERCDFSDPTHWERSIRSGIACHFPEGGKPLLEERISSVEKLLYRITGSTWTGESPHSKGIDLSLVGKGECLHEMEFYFPVRGVDVATLEETIEGWAKRNGLDYLPGAFEGLGIDGYLTGSIDLLFVQNERFYVLDWKTNSPLQGQARSASSYDRKGMHAQMCHGRYYLQALIYSVATAAFLRDRMGASFEWETHMGGFIYCFVRGLGPNSGWLHGTFREAEVHVAAQALGQETAQITMPTEVTHG